MNVLGKEVTGVTALPKGSLTISGQNKQLCGCLPTPHFSTPKI